MRKLGGKVYWLVQTILILLGILGLEITWFDSLWPAAITDSVGTSLIATGVAGAVISLYVSHQAVTADLLNEIQEAGILRVLRQRSTHIKPEYDSRLRRARQIDLLGIGLSAFREDYKDSLEQIARSAKIRILLLDPSAPAQYASYADQKDVEEQNPKGQTRSDINAFIEAFRPLQEKFPEKFELRLYSNIPGVNILRIDHEAFWGPYIAGRASRNMPSFIVRRGGFLFESLEQHFEILWGKARAIPDKSK